MKNQLVPHKKICLYHQNINLKSKIKRNCVITEKGEKIKEKKNKDKKIGRK
jgi:hypothetical protein